MTTARDIITLALNDAGVFGMGQTPGAEDINNGLIRLQDMMSQWQRVRWLIWHLVDVECPATGATSYNIGPGEVLDFARPDRLEAARIIQNNPPSPNDVGWPLGIIQSKERYNNIRLQHLGSFPNYIFYDAAFPIGKVYPWPLPSSLYTLRVIIKEVLQTFATLNDVLAMPPEFSRAIRYNLQEEFLSAYKLPPDPLLTKRAAAALNIIRNANFQMPTLQLPPELARDGLYNIFSDNTT